MGRFVLACFILAQILVFRTMAVRSESSEPYPPKLRVRSFLQSEKMVIRTADPPVSSGGPEASSSSSEEERASSIAEAPENRRMGKHHSSDKSVAGGGVIIGGLVTAIFAAVYCYIRVTRRREADNKH
ncbi:unnamed protein product [Ilex paraguariensis]|uniref:Uncharacterized protein n=1 Tax=Ilex paraguariensis TaxID=185542 RepID=A0ABC8SZU7_9AQUA